MWAIECSSGGRVKPRSWKGEKGQLCLGVAEFTNRLEQVPKIITLVLTLLQVL